MSTFMAKKGEVSRKWYILDAEGKPLGRVAAKAAHIHKYIMCLANGYETVITEDGGNISKGQKQLLTIARAMLYNSKMLILDEATSNVDTRTERQIQSAMRALMKDKTTILIAHRISTIEHMDRILFIDDGKVVAFGSHKELMESCEDYKALVAKQVLEDEEKKKEEEA